MRRDRGQGFTLVELAIVIAATAIVAAILVPALASAVATARRLHCANNLREIGTALRLYRDAHDAFPPSVAERSGGSSRLHTWLAMILPYAGAPAVYQAYNFDEGFNSPANQTAAAQTVRGYLCPSDDLGGVEGYGFAPCTYAANSGTEPGIADGVMFPGSAVRAEDVADGLSWTLAAAELHHHNLGWARGSAAGVGGGGGGGADSGFARAVSRWWKCASPCARPGLNPPKTNCSNRCEQRFQYSSLHAGGVNALYCDGRVSFASESSDARVLRAVFTRDGGELERIDP